ncbi:MAG TPA: hypothetical protein VJS11_04045 [Acidobacteriaceae bacterium]|nr:hypothetical protein [Acidobacteriaceae bacterium]
MLAINCHPMRTLSTFGTDHTVEANPRVRSGRFYLSIAVVSALLVFAGFARSYYLRSVFGFPALAGFLHLHGLVMTLWFVLFVVQVWLIMAQRTRLHRQLGVFGIGLAVLMVAITGTVVIRAARRGFTAFPETVKWPGFLLLSLGLVLTFAILFGAAVWLRARSGLHKRLMVLASLSLWGAAIARLPLHFIEAGSLWTTIAVGDACVVTCVAIDSIRNRRLNPAFLWGGLLILCSHPLLIWIGNTSTWARMAMWLVC